MKMNVIVIIAVALTAMMLLSESAPSQRAQGVEDDRLLEYSRIEVMETVAAPLADAWRSWSTSAGAMEFFAPHAEIEPHPGGPFEIWFMPANPPGQRGAEGLKVLSVLPGEMISFEWNAPPKFEHARPQKTWVVVTFQSIDANHTRVRLVHLGWDEMKAKNPDHIAEWDQVTAYFEAAWPKVLGWMKQRFEEGPRWSADGQPLWKSEQPK